MPEKRVATRAEKLTPEEKVAGSDDPGEQARLILEDSDIRSADRDASPGTFQEHRTSEVATAPPTDEVPD